MTRPPSRSRGGSTTLAWRHYIGDGLWQDYPPEVQAQYREALLQADDLPGPRPALICGPWESTTSVDDCPKA